MAAIAGGIVALACAESLTPGDIVRDLDLVVPGIRGEHGATSFNYGDDQLAPDQPNPEPGALPPEFQQAPTIYDWHTEARFEGSRAAATASMNYFGSHASQTLNMVVRFNNVIVAQPQLTSSDSELWPWRRTLTTGGTVNTTKPCGQRLDASSQHKAWHQFPLVGAWTQWGYTDRPSQAESHQPPCQEEEGGPTGSGGGNVVYTCYCRDYYSYATEEWVHGGIVYCVEG
jgi:hypothetical protein